MERRSRNTLIIIINIIIVETSALTLTNHLVGLMVKPSTSSAEDPWFDSRLRRGIFPGRVISVI